MTHDSELAALVQRAQRACEDITTVRDELAITCAETQRLIAIARQVASATDAAPAPAAPIVVAEATADVTDQEVALEALRMMHMLLAGFPLEWQVKMVKTLTARTMLVVAMRSHNRAVTPAA